jgi:hypothetical protein
MLTRLGLVPLSNAAICARRRVAWPSWKENCGARSEPVSAATSMWRRVPGGGGWMRGLTRGFGFRLWCKDHLGHQFNRIGESQ